MEIHSNSFVSWCLKNKIYFSVQVGLYFCIPVTVASHASDLCPLVDVFRLQWWWQSKVRIVTSNNWSKILWNPDQYNCKCLYTLVPLINIFLTTWLSDEMMIIVYVIFTLDCPHLMELGGIHSKVTFDDVIGRNQYKYWILECIIVFVCSMLIS